MIDTIALIRKREATEAEMEEYSYGKCMWFALALHDLTQWPIQALIDKDNYIGHSWILTPTGENLDIVGINGADDFIQLNPQGVKYFSRQAFVELIGQENQSELLKATQLIYNLYGFLQLLNLERLR